MGLTPDRAPGPSIEEELQLEDRTADGDPTIVGAIRYLSGTFRMRDAVGVFDPRTGSGGITAAQHDALRQLIHFLDEGPGSGFSSGAYKEIVGGIFPTSVTWYDDATKAKKLVEKLIERSVSPATNIKPTPIIWRIYDTDGSTVLATVSDAISYSGIFEVSRVRTIT